MKILVPGNLLLLGEYAITLEGRLGLAAAVECYLVIEAKPSPSLKILGNYEGKNYHWEPGEDFPLLDLITKTIGEFPPLHIHIDSSQFCYSDGTKKGYGSSAATVVGLTYLFLHTRLNRAPDLYKEVLPLALSLHRTFQGGRGSGYDVFASLIGGAGIFTGGAFPLWQFIDPQVFSGISLVRGPRAVSTKDALKIFETFISSHPKSAKYLSVSDRLVHHFIQNNPQNALKRAACVNRWLHRQLNMPIAWTHEIKALGAGGEIGATYENQGEPFIISPKGLQCL